MKKEKKTNKFPNRLSNRRLSPIMVKLICMSALPVFVLGLILCNYGQRTLRANLKSEIQNGLESIAIAVNGSYAAAGDDDFTVLESGNIIKGTTVISGNYDLYDQIKQYSDTDTALYINGKLVVTSLTDQNGTHLTDFTPDDAIQQEVLKDGETYFSQNIQINGETYYGFFMPVKNQDGTTAGMIFAGKEAASVSMQLRAAAIEMMSISLILIIFAVVITGFIAARIASALKRTSHILSKVSDGDLRPDESGTKAIRERSDEIGTMTKQIKELRASLQQIIGNLHTTSEKLTQSASDMEQSAKTTENTSEDMRTAVEEISSGASSQAEETSNAMNSIEQMGGLIEEMVSDIEKLAEQSKNIDQTSQNVNGIVQELTEYTNRTTEVISEISHQTEMTNSSAHEIQSAVEIIQSIAEETNLLSLNASIEAARAGENGRGFAVVAAQIQKLAEQSNQSAQQIEKVIADLLSDSENSVQTMREVVEMVDSQDSKLKETAQGFIDVNNQIRQSQDSIANIREKSQIIDHSRNDIMEVVTNLSAISEENASVAQETASAGENLSSVVESMTREAVLLKQLSEELEQQIDSFIL